MPMNLPDFRDKIDKESDLVFLLRMYYVSVLYLHWEMARP